MTKHIRTWAVLVLAGFALNCGTTTPDADSMSSTRQGVLGNYCDDQHPCDPGEVCDASNTCAEPPPDPDPCENVQCWFFETCMDGFCIPDMNNCLNTGCDTGFFCEGGTCVPDCIGQGNCGSCYHDFNCDPGYVCQDEKCVEAE